MACLAERRWTLPSRAYATAEHRPRRPKRFCRKLVRWSGARHSPGSLCVGHFSGGGGGAYGWPKSPANQLERLAFRVRLRAIFCCLARMLARGGGGDALDLQPANSARTTAPATRSIAHTHTSNSESHPPVALRKVADRNDRFDSGGARNAFAAACAGDTRRGAKRDRLHE